jgi:hypothetical protein
MPWDKWRRKTSHQGTCSKRNILTAVELTQHITKGETTSKAPHNKGVSGLSDGDAKLIAEFIKTLK